jgi:hypothetical protein
MLFIRTLVHKKLVKSFQTIYNVLKENYPANMIDRWQFTSKESLLDNEIESEFIESLMYNFEIKLCISASDVQV